MNNPLQHFAGSALALFRSVPVPARVAVVVVALLVLTYLWQFLVGLFFLAALMMGVYTMIKWLVK